MDALKTIYPLKPYTQRRQYFRNMDDNPQPPTTKKVRGGAKLEFLTKVKKGEKVEPEFRQGVPDGPNTNKISTYCGKMTENGENFPFDIHDWSEIPYKEEKLEEAIEDLKVNFIERYYVQGCVGRCMIIHFGCKKSICDS
ncbi:hypothetical protein MKW98_024168 [Papaver atlanticum]|uniref:Uncharacterized protein n=1 Tax=Papaver atlanticum TaxID=357466 RepID=A0AAD4XPE6_9MAGN|nr:hypothetical protein MKW98_024168 [Papaver atlanticum]